jgi:hypothetical protein
MQQGDIVLLAVSSVTAGAYELVLIRALPDYAFDRKGDRKDLEMGAKVTAPGWLALWITM